MKISLKTPHPELYYNNFLEYQLDHYQERINEEKKPEVKKWLKNELKNLMKYPTYERNYYPNPPTKSVPH